MNNRYRCAHCKNVYLRNSTKKWIKSFCGITGRVVHLQLVGGGSVMDNSPKQKQFKCVWCENKTKDFGARTFWGSICAKCKKDTEDFMDQLNKARVK